MLVRNYRENYHDAIFGATFFNAYNPVDYGSEVVYAVFTPSAVPEPSAWAMIIMGFGAAGFMIRRVRRNVRDAISPALVAPHIARSHLASHRFPPAIGPAR